MKSKHFATAMQAIEVNQVSKSYGKVKALDNVSFSVDKGEVFGLI